MAIDLIVPEGKMGEVEAALPKLYELTKVSKFQTSNDIA